MDGEKPKKKKKGKSGFVFSQET